MVKKSVLNDIYDVQSETILDYVARGCYTNPARQYACDLANFACAMQWIDEVDKTDAYYYFLERAQVDKP